MTATTTKAIVPDRAAKGQKPLSKAHKAKLAESLAKWRASLTDEDRAALSERMRQQNKARWEAKSKKEKAAALAGVRAWQAAQRAAKAKPASKAGAKPKAKRAAPLEESGESAAPKRTRKAAAR